MPYIQPIISVFENRIMYQNLQRPYLASYTTILSESTMHNLHKVQPDDDLIFICSPEFYLKHKITFDSYQHLTLITASSTSTLDHDFIHSIPAENLICTTVSIPDMYGRVLGCFHQYHIWRSKLNASFTYSQPETILPALSSLAGCAAYIYSRDDMLLMDYSVKGFQNDFTQHLKTSFHIPKEVLPALPKIKEYMPQNGSFPNGYQYLVLSMKDLTGYQIYLLLVYTNQLTVDLPDKDFLYIIAGQWEKHLNFQQIFHHTVPVTPCDQLLEQLFTNTLTDPYLIEEALLQLDYPVFRSIGFLYIRFPELKNPALYQSILKNEIQELLPGLNIGYYQKAIIVIITPKCAEQLALSSFVIPTAFQTWLKERHAYAIMSTSTHYFEKLHTLLVVTEKLNTIRTKMFPMDEYRIFYAQKLAPYSVIDFCSKELLHCLGHDDLIYLTHPTIIRIREYDKENGTNYQDVLFAYLYSSCSVNHAAAILFMHRNTVRNQISKICSLFSIDLDDDELRFSLLFSYYIIRYYEQVSGHPVIS